MKQPSEYTTEHIKEAEAKSMKDMTERERMLHEQLIKDLYWQRRRQWEKERGLTPSII